MSLAREFAIQFNLTHGPAVVRLILLLLLSTSVRLVASVAIEIDLAAQKAFLLQDGQIVYESPISSGRASHPTPTGNFAVLERDANHMSSLYGKIVDGDGRTLVSSADRAMPVPKGAKFVQAPMKNFLRFDGASGMHAGHLPGYPASHGCVRMPAHKAALFFDIAEVGTPVRVFGKAPTRSEEPKAKAEAAPQATPPSTPPPRKWYQIFSLFQPRT